MGASCSMCASSQTEYITSGKIISLNFVEEEGKIIPFASPQTSTEEEPKIEKVVEKGFEPEVARKAMDEALEQTPRSVEMDSLSRDFYIAKQRYHDVTPFFAKKKKVFSYLARKGYSPEDIWEAMEGLPDEN